MQIPPPSVLATYPTPNYVNPETRGAYLIATHAILLPIASLIVGIRIYTRVRISKNIGLDDLFIILAMVLAVAFFCMSIYTYATGGGFRHVWDIEIEKFPLILKQSLAAQILFGTTVTLVKVSMLFLTRKIMATHNNTIKWIIYAALFYTIAGNISYTLVSIFQCTPVSDYWTLSFKPQNCINSEAHLLVAGIQNVVTDFLVVLIPIPVVMKLNMPPTQRALVVLLFSIGFAVCIVGTVRTVLLQRISGSNDFTWEVFPVFVTGAVELYVGIICASIPPIKAFVSQYVPKFFTVASSSASEHSAVAEIKRTPKSDPERGALLYTTNTNDGDMIHKPDQVLLNGKTVVSGVALQKDFQSRGESLSSWDGLLIEARGDRVVIKTKDEFMQQWAKR